MAAAKAAVGQRPLLQRRPIEHHRPLHVRQLFLQSALSQFPAIPLLIEFDVLTLGGFFRGFPPRVKALLAKCYIY